jgi:hypothetical protein
LWERKLNHNLCHIDEHSDHWREIGNARMTLERFSKSSGRKNIRARAAEEAQQE